MKVLVEISDNNYNTVKEAIAEVIIIIIINVKKVMDIIVVDEDINCTIDWP